MTVPEIIVNGLRYHIGNYSGNQKVPNHWKGLGGRHWTVRFHDHRIIKTDDLFLDSTFKSHHNKDTAIILEGWNVTSDSPICAWLPAGDHKVYGPVR